MESSSGSEWEDVEDDGTAAITCLFCLEAVSYPEAVFKHCSVKHEIDIVKMIKEHGTVMQYSCKDYGNIVHCDAHAQLNVELEATSTEPGAKTDAV